MENLWLNVTFMNMVVMVTSANMNFIYVDRENVKAGLIADMNEHYDMGRKRANVTGEWRAVRRSRSSERSSMECYKSTKCSKLAVLVAVHKKDCKRLDFDGWKES